MDADSIAVRDFRVKLWSEHFRSANPDDLLDLTKALGVWEPAWNPAGGSPSKPQRTGFGKPYLDPIDLETGFSELSMTEAQRKHWGMYKEPDSRESWGGLCP